MKSPLLRKRGLDELLKMYGDEDYATHQHHAEPPSYQKPFGEKGTEPESNRIDAEDKESAVTVHSPVDPDKAVTIPQAPQDDLPEDPADAEFFKRSEGALKNYIDVDFKRDILPHLDKSKVRYSEDAFDQLVAIQDQVVAKLLQKYEEVGEIDPTDFMDWADNHWEGRPPKKIGSGEKKHLGPGEGSRDILMPNKLREVNNATVAAVSKYPIKHKRTECCGSITGYHKVDCPVYTNNMEKTFDLLKRMPAKRGDYIGKSVLPVETTPGGKSQYFKERQDPTGTQYQCLDCGYIGAPGRHGRCAKCDSNAITHKIYADPKRGEPGRTGSKHHFLTEQECREAYYQSKRDRKIAAKNVPDPGQYDEDHEDHVRGEAREWSQYAETGVAFDPSGNYLCGTCDMRQGENECMRVEGPISFTKGSCRMYHKGAPENQLPMEKKFTKAEAKYSESNQGGFGCHRCEYGGEASEPDAEGRASWCSFWGMHIEPNACCAEQELVQIGKAAAVNLKWRVDAAPTGRYRSFDKRGWPSAGYSNGDIAVTLHCEDEYIPSQVKLGQHGPITVWVADWGILPEEKAKRGAFVWRKAKSTFPTLKEAQAAAAKIIGQHPELHPEKPVDQNKQAADYTGQFGLRWQEFDKNDRLVTKEKWFPSSELREGFANKLETKDNFKEFVAWSDPKIAGKEPKCPHCGASDYVLMPTDFETAKCNKCGKNWNHGIVKGINEPPKQAGLIQDVMRPDHTELPAPMMSRIPPTGTICPDCGGGLTNSRTREGKTEKICTCCKFGPKKTGVFVPYGSSFREAQGRKKAFLIRVDGMTPQQMVEQIVKDTGSRGAASARAWEYVQSANAEMEQGGDQRLLWFWQEVHDILEGKTASKKAYADDSTMVSKFDDTAYPVLEKQGDVEIHETPKDLPPRDDMRRHLDKDVQDEVMEGVLPEKVADDEDTEFVEPGETFIEDVEDAQQEAYNAFMSDPAMQQYALDDGITIEQLWEAEGKDYTNEFWAGRPARTASKTAACPNCNSSKMLTVEAAGDVIEAGEPSLMECEECSMLFTL